MSFVKKKKEKRKRIMPICIRVYRLYVVSKVRMEGRNYFLLSKFYSFYLFGFRNMVSNGRFEMVGWRSMFFCRYSVKHALVVNWVPVHGCIEWYSMEATELLLLCLMPYVYYVWFGWSCTQFIDESPGLTRPVNYLSMVYNNKITYSQSFFQLD